MSIKSGIYQILNKINGKSYIGSAVDINNRWALHRSHFKNNQNSQYLQNAWNKYGEDAWQWNILEYVCNLELLIEIEQYWIDFLETSNFNFGYNICSIAGSSLGLKRSEETKNKLRLKIISEETKKKISEAKKGKPSSMMGKLHSEESKIKMSEAKKGKQYRLGKLHSEETKKKMSEAKKGKLLSKETKNKMSELRKGNKYRLGTKQTEETKLKISKSMTGRVITEETRKKLSEINKGKILTEDHKRKISESNKRK